MTIKAVGIDLGTTYSVVGIFKNDKVDIIANGHGNRTTPSLVSFNDEVRLIGDAAKKQANLNPVNSVSNVKRLIGQKFDKPGVQKNLKHWPHKVVCGNDNNPMLEVEYQKETRTFAPEQISAMILANIKDTVETYLGYTVQNAVITVPAYFNDSQRQATKDAGRIAGFNVIGILNEPTAAAIAYGFEQKKEGKKNILVYDLGGGTFDVTILVIDNGQFTVKSTSGDVNLGGEDFDNQLVEYFAKDVMRTCKVDVKSDPRALRRLKTACELAKRNLSFETDTTISLETFINKKDYCKSINRTRFEGLCEEMFNRTLDIVKDALNQSGFDKTEIDDVVLVGGSTRIPKIQKLLSEFFNGKQLSQSIHPDEAVAFGATIYAEMLSKNTSDLIKQLKLSDVTPLTLGIIKHDQTMSPLILRNTTVPTRKTKQYVTAVDKQDLVRVEVCEGERKIASENNVLGRFELIGVERARKGVSKINVTFEIDIDGILEVTAVDATNGSKTSIKIDQKKGRLSDEQIDQMIADEQMYKEREALQIEIANCRNRLENLLDDIMYHLDDKMTMIQISPEQRKNIMNAQSTTSDWFEQEAENATKEDLEEKYQEFKEQCRCLEKVIKE